MARKSRLKARRAVSGFLFLVFVGFTAAGIAQLRNDYFLAGTELIGWACIPLTIVLGVTLPVKCKVKRTNGKACKRWAYGFLIARRRESSQQLTVGLCSSEALQFSTSSGVA